MANPLLDAQKYDQSIWYDNLRRGLITSGELAQLVERDGLLGVTANLSIFERALAGSTDYDQAVKALVAQGVETAQDVYERLTTQDVQLAADLLYPAYVRTQGRDGFVSLEVSPHLANDTKDLIEEARRRHSDVRRDNVLIQIPATAAGITATQQLISEGISVQVGWIFDLETYEQVAEAYLTGIEAYGSKGGDVAKVASVAGFHVSRIDVLADARLEQSLDSVSDSEQRRLLKTLVGNVALAGARLVYARYRELYSSERWKKLAAERACPQRLLWTSTGSKNPKYARTIYVESLLGPDTINALSSETLVAFRELGRVRPGLTENWAENLDHAREIVQTLSHVGLSMKELAATLQQEGLAECAEAYDGLLSVIESKRQAHLGRGLNEQRFSLGEHQAVVDKALAEWRVQGKVRQLWHGDSTLWTGSDEGGWLAWLHAPKLQTAQIPRLIALAEDVSSAGFHHVVILGMGGSVVCPEFLSRLFGSALGRPELIILDTIEPTVVQRVSERLDLTRTLFVVSSKSGGTIETGSLFRHFFETVRHAVGFDRAGSHFVAITDPKTRLHVRAKAERFRNILFTWPESPGRFSALSNLGLAPAALLGVDMKRLLQGAQVMAHACASCVPPELNPGVKLGVVLGTLAQKGRDKLTLCLTPGLATFGPWLEQLVSESTGKDGKGILVVEGEPLGSVEDYGTDRVFLSLSLGTERSQESTLAVLEQAGHPVIRIRINSPLDVGQELFRWQMATAAAGAVLGINPFTMPDVEAAKVATRNRLDAPLDGVLAPRVTQGELSLFADEALEITGEGVRGAILAHLARLNPGDYFAINAFLENTPTIADTLAAIRLKVRERFKVATTLGFSPRLLHSTGQIHKGGPNTGLFLMLTSDSVIDLPVPEQTYSFGTLRTAQALGDFDVLVQRQRRTLRVHLGKNVEAGLRQLLAAFD